MPGHDLPLPPENPRDLYVVKGMSLDQVSVVLKGFKGCSKRQLARRSRDENWVDARAKHVAKVSARVEETAAVTEAALRVKQLKNYGDTAIIARGAMGKLAIRMQQRDQISREDAQSFDSLSRALDRALRGERSLVSEKDDRIAAIMDRAAELAKDKIDDVIDWDVESELQGSMTPTAMIDLSFGGARAPKGVDETEEKLATANDD